MTFYIPRSQCSVRFLNLPSQDPEEIKNMLAFETANMFPLKPEELVWDFVITDKLDSGYSRVMLAACRKEVVTAYLSSVAGEGANSRNHAPGIGLSTLSLFNQFAQKLDPAAAVLCVHIEGGQMEIVGIHGRKLNFSRGIPLAATGDTGPSLLAARETAYSLKLLREETAVEKILVSVAGEDAGVYSDDIRRSVDLPVEALEGVSVPAGSKVETARNSLRIDLLPAEVKEQRTKNRRMKALLYFGGLLLLNLSLLANLGFMKMKAKVQYLSILKKQTVDISPKAMQLQQKMLKAQVLNRYVNSGRMTLKILTEVYKLAPSGVLLNTFDLTEGQPAGSVVIVGEAAVSESVLRYADALKNSKLFSKTEVTYVTKRASSAVQLFDFEIRASY